MYSDYIIGSKDYIEDINIVVRNKGIRHAMLQMDRDKERDGIVFKYNYEYSNSFYGKYSELVEETLENLGLHDGFSYEFRQRVIEFYKETGKGVEGLFERIQSPEEQDFEILTEADLRAVIALKATYAVYAQQNKEDQMAAILRAIDTIRNLPRYKGKYDFQNKKGEYISIYGYHNKKIETDIHISQANAARDTTIANSGLTALGAAPPPYSIIALLISIGMTDEFSNSTEINTGTVVNTGLTIASLQKGTIGKNFSRVGILKGGYDTYKSYQDLKDFTNTYVTIHKGSLYETHVYQFNSNLLIEKVGNIKNAEYAVPPRFRHYEEKYPDPDLKLYYPGAGERFWFKD